MVLEDCTKAGSVFQFTPLREGRLMAGDVVNVTGGFQFTPLREGRPDAHRRQGKHLDNFNSRPCVRGDVVLAGRPGCCKFQFTPLREGRPEGLFEIKQDFEFQFTPLREGRRHPDAGQRAGVYFNSRPCVRGDTWEALNNDATFDFNSRPCVRGDRRCPPGQPSTPISIHAPA